MKIILAKSDKLLTYMLPNNISGNVWLSEIDDNGIEKNIINIEANQNKNWKIVSNSDYYVVENSKRVPFAIAEENSFFTINNIYSSDKIYLFALNTYEKMNYYECNSELNIGLTIGSDSNSTICYKFNAMPNSCLFL